MKILIVAATHGNEPLGIMLIQHILKKRKELVEYTDFIIGNPKAFVRNLRYTEVDLNRSYGLRRQGYEIERSRHIRHYIKAARPDLVLDMHTTACEQPDIMITAAPENSVVKQFLAACHIDIILKTQPLHDITTVIDQVVAYEIANSHLSSAVLDRICDDIQRFVDARRYSETKTLYQMTGKIFKTDYPEAVIDSFRNFQMTDYNFIPSFIGENSYKSQTDYRGFKLSHPQKIKV